MRLFPVGKVRGVEAFFVPITAAVITAAVLSVTDQSRAEVPVQHSDEARRVTPPSKVAHFSSMPKPAVLPDGTLAAYFIDHEGPGLAPTPERQTIYARYSSDEGRVWSSPASLIDLPHEAGGFGYFVVLVDRDGEVHFFILCDAGTGVVRPRSPSNGSTPVELLARQRLDIWHVKSRDDRATWTTPKQIWQGRAGDLQSVIQHSSGRIILPVCYFVDRNWSKRGEGLDQFTYTGQFDTTVLYSDDGGESWNKSSSVLRTVTPDLSSYGAVEPVLLELADGRVWMLVRTQLGRFYESFSDDGSVWSPARPSQITSSDSPAAVVRLPDRRILLLWNNCQRHPYAQGSRHVLHAALSTDEGNSWCGCREIIRDPRRLEPPPLNGDHGVSYPFVAVNDDGDVFYSLWVQTGDGRSFQKLEPGWLDETAASDDFSNGLTNWSTFGTHGASLAKDPQRNAAQVLSLQKENADWPPAAVWNFPKGESGRLKTRLLVEQGAPTLRVELADHFSPPADEQSYLHSVFYAEITDKPSASPHHVQVVPENWTEIELNWNCDHGSAELSIDGVSKLALRQRHVSPGPSYIRFALPEGGPSKNRVLIGGVDVEVSNKE